jgi:DNA repair exonuclease SbcCD ATPase subunit
MLKALKLLIEDISVLKELFGKKGIKNNFIDLYVNALSSIMNNTLKSILPNTQVRITTTKENSKGDTARKINIEILKEDNIMNYFDLSGGERKRLDLTFSLSIHSLLESLGIFSTNILIFDEAFDQLDSESIETFSNYLRGYNKESIFIITHSAVTAYADSLLVVGDYNG